MAKGRIKPQPQVADLSDAPLAEGKTAYNVSCPSCKTEFDLVLPAAGLSVIQNIECPKPDCLHKFSWDVSLSTAIESPVMATDEIPLSEPLTQTEQENAVVAEALQGIDEALSQEVLNAPVENLHVLQQPFSIGEVIVIGKTKAIILDYEKFVKYAFGLIILGNPGLATSYVSNAGKNKLFALLGIEDRGLQEKTWAEFKEMYHKLYNKR